MIPYILRAGLMLAGCLIFYKILLQKETFFRLNRWVLFICLIISFSLPLIQVPQQWSFRKADQVAVLTDPQPAAYDNTLTNQETRQLPVQSQASAQKEQGISLSQVMTWAGWLYWFGVAVFGASFLFQVVILLYYAYTRPVIKDGLLRIVELSGDKAPCSFGNIIFINPAKYDLETYNQILLHEKIHIQQGHSLDILLSEIVLIFQWFNPFAWLYRKELGNNLEFLTDDQVLHHPEIEKKVYQLSLLKVSAPHFPLNVTTNYNQSLLKKRVAMMNAKKSNMHTTWKYFFLLPLLALFVSLLNEPKAVAQAVDNKNAGTGQRSTHDKSIETEGYWFATIKDDKISIQFKNDKDDESYNNSSFMLSEIKNLPRETSGTFTLTRDAGTIQFTGKFEGNQGMGRYKFTADKDYSDAMQKEGIDIRDDKDLMVFFFVDVRRDYVQMLKGNGYTHLKRDDLIPLAALKVDNAFIQSLKKNGFSNIGVHDLIPLKALGVTGEYIEEIRKAGYPNVSVDKLISFKAQGIDGKYITDLRSAKESTRKEKGEKPETKESEERAENPESPETPERKEISADDIIAIKALDINQDYIRSLKEVGYNHLSNSDLIAMRAQHINAKYIKGLQAAGYKNIRASELIAIKAQNVTPEFVKSFESVGIRNISLEDAIPLRALDVTPAYIKSFQDAGFKDISVDRAVSLKAQDITPSLIKEYKALGFDYISLDDLVSAKATGTTPAFISAMKEKGHNLRSIDKYIQLKNALD